MSVQMIELEEVTMVETTDEALEAAQGGVLRWNPQWTSNPTVGWGCC